MEDVGRVARQQVVNPDHGVITVEECLGQVRANEPGRSSNDDAFLHKFGHLVIWLSGH
jgi:hypothetical protein